MSNEEKNAVVEEVLSQVMTNVISGIFPSDEVSEDCLLYTSDAADD